jgi:hypothetical protein
MRMKNKMKDFEVEFEEWWEVVEEYLELEQTLAQHRANERIIGYKLEAYQIKNSRFYMWQSNKYRVLG